MNGRQVAAAAVVIAVAGCVVSVASVLAAGTSVPGSRVTRYQVAVTANTLKPAQCAGISLTNVVAGVTGTNSADLLLGSSAANSMNGRNGNDCILGGGGNDTINCGSGTDVAIGGPGTDTFNANCETRIQ